MLKHLNPATLLLAIFLGPWHAQEADSLKPAGNADIEESHAQLRQLRERMFDAYQQRDIDALLADVSEDVVITWQNGERNTGHAEFKAFYNRMMVGDNSVVREISSEFEVDEKSILYGGDTAIAYGSQADHFVLNDGSDFTLNSRWTATVEKTSGQWKVASFHVSANIFDNPLLDFAKGLLVKVGIVASIAGLLLGFLITKLMSRPSADTR